MKKLIFLLICSMAISSANAQIFDQYKRRLKDAEKRAADNLKEGADFVIDPIESVPVEVRSFRSMAEPTNWGKDLLLPASLAQRLRTECAYKVCVKVADTGHPDHTALKQGQLPGANYSTDQNVSDLQGHSTHVLGIIAADGLGMCDALVDKGLLTHKAIKVLSNSGSGSFQWLASAFAAERADDIARISRGEFVVYNGSLGGGTSLVEVVENEIKKSTEAGAIFCFAAGNTGGQGVNYPGNGKYSIACGSLDQNQARSSYSTFGPEVWAAMPGRSINSTYKGNTWALLSGTSMATPFLTSAVAIAYSKWGPKLGKLERVRAYLAWCAKDLGAPGKDNEYGWGIELIANILDRDPVNTPGLPTDPNPPPPVKDTINSVSPILVTLKGSYKVLWGNYAASSAKEEATTFKTAGKGSKQSNRALAMNEVLVRYEILAPSSGSADTETERLEGLVTEFFTNRGFLIPQKQDGSWAAYWSAYFLEMWLDQQKKWPVDVSSVKIESKSGQTVTITNLRRWPIRAISGREPINE